MYGILSRRSAANVLGVVALAVAVAGCDLNAASRSVTRGSVAQSTAQNWYRGEQPVVRSQVDAIRSRIWVLTLDGVALYEASTGEQIAQISLPGWLWAGEQYSCPPDLAIGPGGEAVISSNVVPTLWRIDPVTLAASEHALALDADTGKDIGFTGLTYSAQQGAFFAVSAFQGALWRIDPRLQRAQSIPLSAPLANACGLAMRPRASDQRASRFVGLCVRAEQDSWLVSLAPDQRSGYVSRGSCVSASLTP
jgi:hypothetical protein